MRYHLEIYAMLVAQYFKVKMEYRADFLISLIGMIFMQAIGLFTLWVLFRSVNDIGGWSAGEVLFVYGFAQLVFVPQQLCFDNAWNLGWMLRDGSFIKYYMRPLNSLFYFASDVFDLKGFAQIIIGLATLIYANSLLNIDWTITKIFFLFVCYVSSATIMFAMMVLATSIGFWTFSPASMLAFTERLKTYIHFPLSIYGIGIKGLFTFVIPLGFLGYYPMQMFLKPEQQDFPLIAMPIVALIVACIAYGTWSLGLKRYEGTGS